MSGRARFVKAEEESNADDEEERRGYDTGEGAVLDREEENVAGAVGHAAGKCEKDDDKIGDGGTADDKRSEDEDGDPESVEGEEARIGPLVAEELREFALEAGRIFFGDVENLDGDGEDIEREDF